MARLQAYCRLTICCVGLALLLVAQPLAAVAQQPGVNPTSQLDASQAIDPRPDDRQVTDDPNNRRHRYPEPPPPPYDFCPPTWMPCQSLRTNRSLLLGHLDWGL